MTDLARCIPILASLDLAETLRFYRDQLGFEGTAQGDCAILRRDAMELHAWRTAEPTHPETTACYIRGAQVPLLYAEYAARDVPGLSCFEEKPWNMREFSVQDPHGNLLRFGCTPQEADRCSGQELLDRATGVLGAAAHFLVSPRRA